MLQNYNNVAFAIAAYEASSEVNQFSSKYDDVILCHDNDKEIQIFIDPKVSMFLIGSEMVFKEDELSSGFDFVNPNEKGRCGCGESFNV